MKDGDYVKHMVFTNLLESFVRVFPIEFTENDFIQFAALSGIECIEEEVRKFLEECTVVFQLSDGKYISRGKLFQNKKFSIKPDKYEVENGILILGSRCIPFMDPSIVPEGYKIAYQNSCLERKVVSIPTREVLNHYQLYGEEYAIQYINMDSCNKDIDLLSFEGGLPTELSLSVIDISEILEKTGFKLGDRFILTVNNFLESTMTLTVLLDHRDNPFSLTKHEEEREIWYEEFEKYLIQSIDTFGPCRSIDEQLAYAVLLGLDMLSTDSCGSIAEYLERTECVEITEFGVESRLWRKGSCIEINGDSQKTERPDLLFGIPVNDNILKAFIKDSLWLQKETSENVCQRLIISDDIILPEQYKQLKLHLQKLHSIIGQSYNRFSDAVVGDVRHAAITLFASLLDFACFISQSGVPEEKMPQQEYVIFSQVWSHVSKMIEEFGLGCELDERDCSNAIKSIEGMKYSVAEVSPEIRRAIERYKKQSFSFI